MRSGPFGGEDGSWRVSKHVPRRVLGRPIPLFSRTEMWGFGPLRFGALLQVFLNVWAKRSKVSADFCKVDTRGAK